MSLAVTIVPVTPFQQNCSVVKCRSSGKLALVDPGGDIERLQSAIEQLGGEVEKILLTHGHLDHVGAAGLLREQLGVPIEGPHRDDLFWLDQLPENCRAMGLPVADAFVPDRWLEGGDRVTVGDAEMQVLHCPGHTPGHVVFVHEDDKIAFVGDVLFAGSIGRSDFPRGNHDQLVASIRERLFPLGDDITFVPGHGPNSTFGQERRTNPFVADTRFG
ncbi:beta-lactamase domain protein [Luminiphilus syltensis NOR5-1B]|uniref:Beta-lactamase domain protein n=1 Tax=Luminiphilus syltensis NOR5-1B TaxID=565045 RepID=B8KW30_9GAMM|nr:MBL fold metallo-hydrolase [Luminiphilus syltensis]EED35500.1 beta-lactamase domain protein [Luminiphilus syltensis NOR5-1B]